MHAGSMVGAGEGLLGSGVARVLLVEDDDADAVLVAELLAEGALPVSLTRARTLSEAVAQLDSGGGFVCALVDLGLPDAEGLGALEMLLAVPATVPVVVLTGLDDPARGVEAVAAGAADFLVKGEVDGGSLARTVRFAVERRRAEDAQRQALTSELRRIEYERLERALVPEPVLRQSKVECEILYRAGGTLAVLGGDFLDVVERPDGSIRLVVGDVAGHGAGEAAVGVSLRQAWRALVLAGYEDQRMLPVLQQVLELEHPEALFVTAIDATLSPDGTELCYRVAGHWPALLRRPEGWLALPNDRRGLPLGVAEPEWDDHAVQMPVDLDLLLFTDGLVEARRGDGRLELEGLLGILDGFDQAWTLEQLMQVVEEGNGGALDDDVAAVRLRSSARAAPGRADP